MKRTIVTLIVLLCAGRSFAQGTFTASLDGAHANPPNDSLFTGIANFRLEGNLLTYSVQTTGPVWYTATVGDPLFPSVHVQGPTTVFDLPGMFFGMSPPSFDIIGVYPVGTPLPPVYHDFLSGSLTLSDLQRSELLSGQCLLTIDFGYHGLPLAGQIVAVPEPSEYALLFTGAAVIGCCLRRDGKSCDATRV